MRTRPALLLAALPWAACGQAGSTAEIQERRVATSAYQQVVPDAAPSERFAGPRMDSPSSGSDDLAELIDYDLPDGWKELPANQDRLVNLLPAGNPEASCYLSFLGGSAGGLEGNVNRWRGQFDAAPLSGEEIAALPKHDIFGRDGTLVELTGTFKGMGDGAPRPGYRLIALAVSEPSGSLFLKFSGPSALVEAERERFLSFASSLSVAADHANHGMEDPSAAAGGALRWTAPAGWTQGGPRAMREATFSVGEQAECYISRLGAGAGDLRSNLDRWRDQFALPPVSDADFAAFQRVEQVAMLGLRTPLIELSGSYAGMGGKPVAGQALLGVALFRPQDSLFVKFTGPAEVVRAEKANFLAFVASLEEDS